MADTDYLIGVPFAYGGRGPESYDCYGLLMHLFKQDQGVDLPDYKSPSDGARISAIFTSELRLWERCELKEGAAVLFRVPGNIHVGYCLGKDRFIHTWDRSNGVVIERLGDWKKRLMGVYRYVG